MSSMAIKIGINGFGRIGRNIFRAAHELNPQVEVVAVNDIGDAKTFAHLLKHDTALGTFGPAVSAAGDEIKVDDRRVRFLSHRDPGDLPWRDLGVDIVIDATDGPLLLEANARPGLAIQIANSAGLRPRLAAIDEQLARRGGNSAGRSSVSEREIELEDVSWLRTDRIGQRSLPGAAWP